MLASILGPSSIRKSVRRFRFPRVPLWATLVMIAMIAWGMASVTNAWRLRARRAEEHRLSLVSMSRLHAAQLYRIEADRHRKIAQRLEFAQQDALTRIHIALRCRDDLAYEFWSRKIPWRRHHIENLPKLADWEDSMVRYWEGTSTRPEKPLPPFPIKPNFQPPLDNITLF